MAALEEVFRNVFKDPLLTLTESLSPADVDGWDSLNHVLLVSAIEARFKIKFKLKELMSIDCVRDFVRLLNAKSAAD